MFNANAQCVLNVRFDALGLGLAVRHFLGVDAVIHSNDK
jgi:hypothetical protein